MLRDLKAFQGEEHKAFLWNGGTPAALFVHGFPGTPAELRPLARSLHQQGWTTKGLLLPGFGAEIDQLAEQDNAAWVTAIMVALENLGKQHRPVLLVGYSMGAALAMQAATETPTPLSGLVLLAPFRRLGTWWQQLIGMLLSPFFRQVRPFEKTDFSDPEVRRNTAKFLGGVDLDDPAVQESLRQLTVPTRIFSALHQAGRLGHRAASHLTVPGLVIQGTQDELVSPRHTRALLQQLPGPLRYLEVESDHNLLDPDKAAWPHIEQAVLTFARQLLIERKHDVSSK